jgi:hypothetical protein
MSLSWPVEGKITQQFGSFPSSIQPNGHTGIDFGIPEGTPIYAADSGNIAFEGWATTLSSNNPWWLAPAYAGIVVVINHNDGFLTIYGHLSGTVINNGQFVEKGQLIGHSGNTGLSSGPHLHFEVAGWPLQPYNGYYGRLNPNNYVSGFAGAPAIQPQTSLILSPNQRKVGANNINQRAQPNTAESTPIVRIIEANTVETFNGFVRGEPFEGNDIWYRDDQGYAWSGAFASPVSTQGLPDLTPPKPAAPVIGRTSKVEIKYRATPYRSGKIIDTLPANVHFPSFTEFAHGESINGNDIWFRGTSRGGWGWSGGFTDPSTVNMIEVVAPKEVYGFTPDFDFVEYIPAAISNLAIGNFPDKPTHAVIHQFGALGVDTVGSTINTFTNPNLERVASAHFVVSGKRIIQMVSLKDRAYHAGEIGNNYVGIETDPAQDPDTIASTKKLLAALKAKYGYELTLTRHSEVPKNPTSCGSLIDLNLYTFEVPVTPPVTQPPVEVLPSQPSLVITPEIERAIIERFFKQQLDQYFS